MSTQYETQGYTINNAGRRLVVDPITRIEGHMRCEVNINDQNVITNAVSCGTMFRGLEIILQGRDPRDAWAFVERICGVCTGVLALASVYAIEDAIGTGGYLRYIGQNLESCTDRGRAGEKGRHHHDLGGHEDGNSDRLSLRWNHRNHTGCRRRQCRSRSAGSRCRL